MKKALFMAAAAITFSSCCTIFSSSKQAITLTGPEGTKIYETDDAQIMLAECEGEFVPYLKYVEG